MLNRPFQGDRLPVNSCWRGSREWNCAIFVKRAKGVERPPVANPWHQTDSGWRGGRWRRRKGGGGSAVKGREDRVVDGFCRSWVEGEAVLSFWSVGLGPEDSWASSWRNRVQGGNLGCRTRLITKAHSLADRSLPAFSLAGVSGRRSRGHHIIQGVTGAKLRVSCKPLRLVDVTEGERRDHPLRKWMVRSRKRSHRAP